MVSSVQWSQPTCHFLWHGLHAIRCYWSVPAQWNTSSVPTVSYLRVLMMELDAEPPYCHRFIDMSFITALPIHSLNFSMLTLISGGIYGSFSCIYYSSMLQYFCNIKNNNMMMMMMMMMTILQ